jgi:chromate transporter
MQLATYVGWLLHRIPGGLVAGAFFVIPSIFIMLGITYIYAAYGSVPWIAALFYGLKPAVLAIVVNATIRIGSRALGHWIKYLVAAGSFAALFFFKVPFPLVIFTAAAIGLVGVRFFPEIGAVGAQAREAASDAIPLPEHIRPSLGHALRVAAACLAAWIIPLVVLAVWRGQDDVLFQEGIFFSKAAVVTFGGAYAVLPYVAQQAVEYFHWLTPPQMIDGLGLAETLPGPLIKVLQFVGFMAGWNQAGDLGLWGAILGGLVATYFTFMPCFLWIFLGAPYIEKIRRNRTLNGAMGAITAAVVGVVLNLAVWFGLNVLVHNSKGVDWFALGVTVASFIGMQRFKLDIIPVVAGAATLGLIHRLLF